jgi:Putative peptidoglycan binding domain
MSAKPILFVSCVAAMTLSASVAMAAGHGGSTGGGSSGGGSRSGGFGGFHGGAAPARMTPGFARAGSRFGNGNFRNFRNFNHRFRHRDFDDDNFFFFGDPFFFGGSFYPYGYGYYPYGYPPYGYYPYGNGYGYGSYNQSGYLGSAAGRRSSVVDIQRRLAHAGYYHGRIDGVMGPRTRSAMRAYQRSRDVTEG